MKTTILGWLTKQSKGRFTREEAAMRAFELRVYKLRAKEALDFYMEMIYSHHPNSFPLFGIEAHGFWTANAPEQFRTNSAQPARLLCLCSPAGQGGCSGRSESRCQPEPQCLQSQ